MNQTQLDTLKQFILTTPELASAVSSGQDGTIAEYLNADAVGYYVWRPITSATAIADAITWANLTPTDTPDGTAIQTNRLLLCQAKQMNLQILLQGRETVATGKSNLRAGLIDALTNVPSGLSGSLQDAGWLGAGKVKATITRLATRAEKLFASGTGLSGTPATLDFEGIISADDVAIALRGNQNGGV